MAELERDSWHWNVLKDTMTPARFAQMERGIGLCFYPETIVEIMDAARGQSDAMAVGPQTFFEDLPPVMLGDVHYEMLCESKKFLFDLETIPGPSFKVVENDPVILYIIVRDDLKTMTAGRSAAQATHAANQLVYFIREDMKGEIDDTYLRLLEEWEEEGYGFGTVIIKKANLDTIQEAVSSATLNGVGHSVVSGMVHDREYSVRDGAVTHLIPLDTCGFLFGRRSIVKPLVADLPLL